MTESDQAPLAGGETPSIQERYAPRNTCYGCGPANESGLHVRSFPGARDDGELVCEWTPRPRHQAFGNVLNGGVLGTLFDCHCNWTATLHLMRRDGLDRPPCTVTLDFTVRMKRPTALDEPVHLSARPVSSEKDRVIVEATATSRGKVTATCTGTFVAVQEGHPAFHRW
jgi:acyl-coenzyme A thioesterase PaaI-like protein